MRKVIAIILALTAAPCYASLEYPSYRAPKTEWWASLHPTAVPFIQVSAGSAFGSENIAASQLWEIRFGSKLGGMESSLGFSNYSSDNLITAPDRLVPGNLALRTLNSESLIHIGPIVLGGGVGWTWISHGPDGSVSLSDLDEYDPLDRLVSVQERVHDGFSATFKTGLEFELSDSISLGITARYFFMHTFRERDVRLYTEDPSLIYADRYYNYLTRSPISFDHWSLLASLRF